MTSPAKRGKRVSEAEFARLWASDMPLPVIGAMLGIGATAVSCRAKNRGLPPRVGGKASTIPAQELKRLWADNSITTEAMARIYGVNRSSISSRAQTLGLPSRSTGGKVRMDDDLFRAMWRFGVRAADIAGVFGFATRSMYSAQRRLGLPSRERAVVPISEWREAQVAEAMADAARVTLAAMRDAEMVDVFWQKKVAA